jgi:hypothetical protein
MEKKALPTLSNIDIGYIIQSVRLIRIRYIAPVFLLTLLWLPIISIAQSRDGSMLWTHLYLQGKISEKWHLNADASLRFRDPVDYLNILLLRIGVHYKPSKYIEYTGGYAYTNAYPLPISASLIKAEHRIWEQFAIEYNKGKWMLWYRLRPEQQWFDDMQSTFRLRLRNLAGLSFSIYKNEQWEWKSEIYNEIFPARDNHNDYNFTDQNRIYAGLYLEWFKKLGFSAGYQHNYFPGRTGKSAYTLHQLRLHLKYKFNLGATLSAQKE